MSMPYSGTYKQFAKFSEKIAIFLVFPVMETLLKKTDKLKLLAFEWDVTGLACGHWARVFRNEIIKAGGR